MSCRSLLLWALLWFAMGSPAAAQEPGEVAYRAGDYTSAHAHWTGALAGATDAAIRGDLLHNLGNAAFRQGKHLEAVARYTAAIEQSPRQADTWANLELARSKAGLDVADRGDLAATTRRLVTILRLPELEAVTFCALALFGLALLLEALRGGRLPKVLGVLFLGLALGLASLHTWRAQSSSEQRSMVTASGGVALRSEPDLDLPIILRVDGGDLVERRDQLPGWLRVRSGGTLGWIEAQNVLAIDQD